MDVVCVPLLLAVAGALVAVAVAVVFLVLRTVFLTMLPLGKAAGMMPCGHEVQNTRGVSRSDVIF